MLENAQVTISLKDLEELQKGNAKNEKYENIIKRISDAVSFNFREYENKADDLLTMGLDGDEFERALAQEKDLAVIYVDADRITSIIKDCCKGKTEDEQYILEDVLKNNQVRICFVGADYGDNE